LDRKWTNIIIRPRDRASISVQQLRISDFQSCFQKKIPSDYGNVAKYYCYKGQDELHYVRECPVGRPLHAIPGLVTSFVAVGTLDESHVKGIGSRKDSGQQVNHANQNAARLDLHSGSERIDNDNKPVI
jgi:hypothetical protein